VIEPVVWYTGVLTWFTIIGWVLLVAPAMLMVLVIWPPHLLQNYMEDRWFNDDHDEWEKHKYRQTWQYYVALYTTRFKLYWYDAIDCYLDAVETVINALYTPIRVVQ